MKIFFSTLLIIFSLNTFANSGHSKSFTVFLKDKSEEELLAETRTLINKIINGSDRYSRNEMEREGCEVRSRNIKIAGLAIYKTYEGINLMPSFTGRLDFSNTNCNVDEN